MLIFLVVHSVNAADLLVQPEAHLINTNTINLSLSPGYLQEAALLSWRFDAVVGCAGLLLDVRYVFDEATIGVLVARNGGRFEWIHPAKLSGPRWYALSGLTTVSNAPFSISIGFEPNTDLNIDASAAELYLCTAAISAGAPPDFTKHDPERLRKLLPGWDTTLEVVTILRLTTSV